MYVASPNLTRLKLALHKLTVEEFGSVQPSPCTALLLPLLRIFPRLFFRIFGILTAADRAAPQQSPTLMKIIFIINSARVPGTVRHGQADQE
jgi:hypothetical protein